MPLVLAEPDVPFWGFGELFTITAIFWVALALAGTGAVGLLHDQANRGYWQAAAMFAAYAVVFAALKVVFFWAGKPLFRSLGWVPQHFAPASLFVCGAFLALLNGILAILLRTPQVQTPFSKMLNGDNLSLIVVTTFGVTLGPVIEELLFRGFLQPVMTSTLGVFPGILITSALFGAVHLAQNAGLWQSGLVITLAGFAFGLIRHVSGSTRASSIAHIGYNMLPCFLILIQGVTQGVTQTQK